MAEFAGKLLIADDGAQYQAAESRSRPGKFYFVNLDTGDKTWEAPEGLRVDGEAAGAGAGGAPTQVRVLHLLKKHRDSRRPASWRQDPITCTKDEARVALMALRDQIVAAENTRESFEALAQVESDCSSARRGGDLDYFGRGQMQAAFENAAFALEVGELSGEVDSDSGLHIILRIA